MSTVVLFWIWAITSVLNLGSLINMYFLRKKYKSKLRIFHKHSLIVDRMVRMDEWKNKHYDLLPKYTFPKQRPAGQGENLDFMKDRKCTFTYSEEVQGNWTKKEDQKGVTRSEVVMKTTDKGTFAIVFVEHEETGQLHEAFANTVKFTK